MDTHLDNRQARAVVLHLQGLADPPGRALDAADWRALIQRLGFVQLDSIQWVERAQHMILHARSQSYRPPMMRRLHERDAALFEAWTHDASVVPVEFYPYWRHRFARTQERLAAKFHQWQGPGYRDHCDALLARIAEHGPIRSRDLERPESGKQEMWQWHDGKAALEYLWRTGTLAISGREHFQKVYDLAERVVPPEHFEARVSRDAFIDWCCREALDRLGFATAGDIARFFDHVTIAEASDWLARQGDNSVVPVRVETVTANGRPGPSRSMHARPDILSIAQEAGDLPKRIRALSPFDPVIRDRKRLSWLFGFDYRIEIYVPEEKRVWGYYVFPLLEGDRLIGRIDMRAHRKSGTLRVRRLWLEPGVKFGSDRRKRLEAELVRQARLAGVTGIEWEADALRDC